MSYTPEYQVENRRERVGVRIKVRDVNGSFKYGRVQNLLWDTLKVIFAPVRQ